MAIEWRKVPEQVLELANEIIAEHHPDLEEFNIGFIFRSEASSSGGKRIIGQAAKAPAKLAPFMDLDGIVWLALDFWMNADALQKRALIDHELCHFEVNNAGELTLRGHDIEEFREIITRYGLWSVDLNFIAPAILAATQTTLPGFERERRQGGVVAVEPAAVQETLNVSVVGAL
jgi:hypothetical protein